uniref:TetR-like C-terminal domain-containing protein n=1 Tax=Nonomuraea lactucae TaxID=2249762 RepID=UPI001964FE7F
TVMGRIVADAWAAGALVPPDLAPPPSPAAAAEMANLAPVMPGVPDDLALRGMTAWTALYGWVNFEVFGQFENTIQDRRATFDHSVRVLAGMMGFAAGRP